MEGSISLTSQLDVTNMLLYFWFNLCVLTPELRCCSPYCLERWCSAAGWPLQLLPPWRSANTSQNKSPHGAKMSAEFSEVFCSYCTSVASGASSNVLAIWAAAVTFSAVSSSGLDVRIWVLDASVSKSAALVSWRTNNKIEDNYFSVGNFHGALRHLRMCILNRNGATVLTFCFMSLSVWSHWKTCGGLKLGTPFVTKHLAEARGLPAERTWRELQRWHVMVHCFWRCWTETYLHLFPWDIYPLNMQTSRWVCVGI